MTLWSDPRYFRCNSPIALEAAVGAYPETTSILGDDPPRSGPWGLRRVRAAHGNAAYIAIWSSPKC